MHLQYIELAQCSNVHPSQCTQNKQVPRNLIILTYKREVWWNVSVDKYPQKSHLHTEEGNLWEARHRSSNKSCSPLKTSLLVSPSDCYNNWAIISESSVTDAVFAEKKTIPRTRFLQGLTPWTCFPCMFDMSTMLKFCWNHFESILGRLLRTFWNNCPIFICFWFVKLNQSKTNTEAAMLSSPLAANFIHSFMQRLFSVISKRLRSQTKVMLSKMLLKTKLKQNVYCLQKIHMFCRFQ